MGHHRAVRGVMPFLLFKGRLWACGVCLLWLSGHDLWTLDGCETAVTLDVPFTHPYTRTLYAPYTLAYTLTLDPIRYRIM